MNVHFLRHYKLLILIDIIISYFLVLGLEEPGWGSGLDEMAAFYGERAKGEVGLIVTGGIAPNAAGQTLLGAAKMTSNSEASAHKVVTDEVHRNGGLIAMQILHTGRYAYHFSPVSASPIKSPISWYG